MTDVVILPYNATGNCKAYKNPLVLKFRASTLEPMFQSTMFSKYLVTVKTDCVDSNCLLRLQNISNTRRNQDEATISILGTLMYNLQKENLENSLLKFGRRLDQVHDLISNKSIPNLLNIILFGKMISIDTQVTRLKGMFVYKNDLNKKVTTFVLIEDDRAIVIHLLEKVQQPDDDNIEKFVNLIKIPRLYPTVNTIVATVYLDTMKRDFSPLNFTTILTSQEGLFGKMSIVLDMTEKVLSNETETSDGRVLFLQNFLTDPVEISEPNPIKLINSALQMMILDDIRESDLDSIQILMTSLLSEYFHVTMHSGTKTTSVLVFRSPKHQFVIDYQIGSSNQPKKFERQMKIQHTLLKKVTLCCENLVLLRVYLNRRKQDGFFNRYCFTKIESNEKLSEVKCGTICRRKMFDNEELTTVRTETNNDTHLELENLIPVRDYSKIIPIEHVIMLKFGVSGTIDKTQPIYNLITAIKYGLFGFNVNAALRSRFCQKYPDFQTISTSESLEVQLMSICHEKLLFIIPEDESNLPELYPLETSAEKKPDSLETGTMVSINEVMAIEAIRKPATITLPERFETYKKINFDNYNLVVPEINFGMIDNSRAEAQNKLNEDVFDKMRSYLDDKLGFFVIPSKICVKKANKRTVESSPNFANTVGVSHASHHFESGGELHSFANFSFAPKLDRFNRYWPQNSENICLPTSDHQEPDFTARRTYDCDNMLGTGNFRTADTKSTALIHIGDGSDSVEGFLHKPNLFVSSSGRKTLLGGAKHDVFVIDTEFPVQGYMNGNSKENTLVFSDYFKQVNTSISLHLTQIDRETMELKPPSTDDVNAKLVLKNIQNFIGRHGLPDYIDAPCTVDKLDLKGGSRDNFDNVYIGNPCNYDLSIKLNSNTAVRFLIKSFGRFEYHVNQSDSSVTIDFGGQDDHESVHIVRFDHELNPRTKITHEKTVTTGIWRTTFGQDDHENLIVVNPPKMKIFYVFKGDHVCQFQDSETFVFHRSLQSTPIDIINTLNVALANVFTNSLKETHVKVYGQQVLDDPEVVITSAIQAWHPNFRRIYLNNDPKLPTTIYGSENIENVYQIAFDCATKTRCSVPNINIIRKLDFPPTKNTIDMTELAKYYETLRFSVRPCMAPTETFPLEIRIVIRHENNRQVAFCAGRTIGTIKVHNLTITALDSLKIKALKVFLVGRNSRNEFTISQTYVELNTKSTLVLTYGNVKNDSPMKTQLTPDESRGQIQILHQHLFLEIVCTNGETVSVLLWNFDYFKRDFLQVKIGFSKVTMEIVNLKNGEYRFYWRPQIGT